MDQLGMMIAGKEIIAYRPQSNKKYSSQDIGDFLKQFSLAESLQLIAELSKKSISSFQLEIKGVPVEQGVLAYIAMRLIECSNDYRGKRIKIEDLLKAIDMYYGIPDPIEMEEDPAKGNAIGSMIRYGQSQFNFNRRVFSLIPRTLIFYRDLWNKLDLNSKLDVTDGIKNIIGLSLEETLCIGYIFQAELFRNAYIKYPKNSLSPNLERMKLLLV